jgi:hypothetical protein
MKGFKCCLIPLFRCWTSCTWILVQVGTVPLATVSSLQLLSDLDAHRLTYTCATPEAPTSQQPYPSTLTNNHSPLLNPDTPPKHHHHVAHLYHVSTPVQANLLVLAPDQADLARLEPTLVTSHHLQHGVVLPAAVLAHRETPRLHGQRPQRARAPVSDTPDFGVELALGVSLGCRLLNSTRAALT